MIFIMKLLLNKLLAI